MVFVESERGGGGAWWPPSRMIVGSRRRRQELSRSPALSPFLRSLRAYANLWRIPFGEVVYTEYFQKEQQHKQSTVFAETIANALLQQQE